MKDKFFYCKSKRLFDYLVKHGSKFVKSDMLDGTFVYVFENDVVNVGTQMSNGCLEQIKLVLHTDLNLWESNMKKCLF